MIKFMPVKFEYIDLSIYRPSTYCFTGSLLLGGFIYFYAAQVYISDGLFNDADLIVLN